MSKLILNHIKNNYLIYILLTIILILHVFAVKQLGFDYTLMSDDISYIHGGIRFLQSGEITMHSVISAQIMPGMIFLIAFFALIFGTGSLLFVSLKVFWAIMGMLTVYFVYKTVKLFTDNQYIAIIPCLFFLSLDYIWMDNVILTETPFLLLFVLLIYYTLLFNINQSKKNYILIIVFYIFALFIRPNIAIYPIFLVIYLLLSKYDVKQLFKKCFFAGIVVVLCLVPWTYRNYKIFHEFIPLTYGTGNPLLLGTYQGYGYPTDDELDYDSNVYKYMNDEMKKSIDNDDRYDYKHKFYSLKLDEMMAKYRMKEWWKKDKKSMLKSYLYIKPKMMLKSCFYWKKLFNIDGSVLELFRKIELCIFGLALLFLIIRKKYIKELVFLLLTYISQIMIYSYTFAFSRYAITLYFLRYIIIGFGLIELFNLIKNRRSFNESINDNSSLQRRVKHRKYSK